MLARYRCMAKQAVLMGLLLVSEACRKVSWFAVYAVFETAQVHKRDVGKKVNSGKSVGVRGHERGE